MDAIIATRPFSCPGCHKIIATSSFYGRYYAPGCLIVLIAVATGLILAGRNWLLSLVAGLVLGIALNTGARALLKRLLPRPPLLGRYNFRTEPAGYPPVAEFLEAIASADTWTPEFEHRLLVLDGQRSKDDWLENSAVESVKDFKKSVTQGEASYPQPPSTLDPGLAEIRERLRSIARDLRFAATQ